MTDGASRRTLFALTGLFSVMFLFFLQTVSGLIENVYILSLLDLTPHPTILGIFFLVSPLILLPFGSSIRLDKILIVSALMLIIARLVLPLVSGSFAVLSAGIGVASFMVFLSSVFVVVNGDSNRSRILPESQLSFEIMLGVIIATLLSIFFRTINSTVDLSLWGNYQALGWVLGIIAVGCLLLLNKRTSSNTVSREEGDETDLNGSESESEGGTVPESGKISTKKVFALAIGIVSVLILLWYVFSSPTVLARCTKASYDLIIIGIMISFGVFSTLVLFEKDWFLNLPSWGLWLWNILFTLSLVFTINIQRVSFPASPMEGAVTAPTVPTLGYLPLVLLIIFSPVLFLDIWILSRKLLDGKPTSKQLGLGFSLGAGLFTILVIFLQIFPYVWGYLEPVSGPFRNQFWLAFFVPAISVFFASIFVKFAPSESLQRATSLRKSEKSQTFRLISIGIILFLAMGTITGTLAISERTSPPSQDSSTLTIMTYNVQQGVDSFGEDAFDEQLEIIRRVDPDIVGLVESDTARITRGNDDVVRYFAEKLNYYSDYGPATVTNTFGVALLSKFPIQDSTEFFTYSEVDEIGTLSATIQLDNQPIKVFVNHPAGSYEVKNAHTAETLSRVSNYQDEGYPIISMGDFNWDENSDHYENTTEILQDSWRTYWGPETQVDNMGMESDARIDHVFLSPEFEIVDAVHILEPESMTDHPVYWAEVKVP